MPNGHVNENVIQGCSCKANHGGEAQTDCIQKLLYRDCLDFIEKMNWFLRSDQGHFSTPIKTRAIDDDRDGIQ